MTDLLYTDVETDLRSSVRGLLDRQSPSSLVMRTYDEPKVDTTALWRAVASELGLAGLLVPESLGGAGASPREVAVVQEEIGRAVAPVPFLTSSVIATSCLLDIGADEQISVLAQGDITATLAVPWSSYAGSWSPIDEVKPVVRSVAGADLANLFVVPVERDGSLHLYAVPREQVVVDRVVSLDETRPLADLTFDLAGLKPLAGGDSVQDVVDKALRLGAVMLASEQLGVAQWCLTETVDHAKVRHQFARPIGSFQAIKHRLADVYGSLVSAEAVARHAAASFGDPEETPIAVSLAQACCSEVAVRAAEEAIQLHGGIGMTWEHPAHLYLKRAKASQIALGIPSQHRSLLAELIGIV